MGSRIVVAIAVTLAAGTARADDVDDLVNRGNDLAKRGELTQAIEQFRRADAKRPRAQHACLIGLAYTRREAWPQAELWFERCRARANPNDPVPDWLDEARHQLADKLAAAGIPALTIHVSPAAARATIAVSGFEPDEAFAPGTVHLSPGRYTIDVTAPAFHRSTRTIDVAQGVPQTIEIALAPIRSSVPWIVIGGGVALAGLGFAFDALELQPLRTQLAKSELLYDRSSSAFDAWRAATIGCWIGGAIAVGVGAWLLRHQRHASVTARIERGGGTILVGWSR